MERQDANFALLQQRLEARCWGRLPYRTAPDPAELATWLQLP